MQKCFQKFCKEGRIRDAGEGSSPVGFTGKAPIGAYDQAICLTNMNINVLL